MANVDGAVFHEDRVRWRGPGGMLAGTLSRPAVSVPRGFVLIIAGSGRSDRDGNVKRLPIGLYRDLARFLSASGFASLRYDKRGVGESEGTRHPSGLWDLVDDACSAVEYLKSLEKPAGAPLLLLGHSEGCTIAAAVNARIPVDGLVLLAGACESLAETLPRQQEMAFRGLEHMKGALGFILRLLRVPRRQRRRSEEMMKKIMATDQPWIRVSGVRVNAKWIREHCEHDINRDLPAVRCPALAITGSKDIQVLPEHARMLAEAVSGPAEWHIIPGMTHLLRRTEKEVDMIKLMKLYKEQIKKPVDGELLALLGSWIDATFPRGAEATA